MKSKQRAERCPYGCGRFILPSRLADHFLIAQVEHSVEKVRQDRTAWAISVLTSEAS